MKKYICNKPVEAKEMSREDYNDYRGWDVPADENPADEGYFIKHENGYETWMLKEAFEVTHQEYNRLSFGVAVELLKKGMRVARKGWNGRGMFIVYQKGYPEGIACNKQTAEAWGLVEGNIFKCNPYMQIKNVDGSHSMWVPSIGDVLAEDWEIIDTRKEGC